MKNLGFAISYKLHTQPGRQYEQRAPVIYHHVAGDQASHHLESCSWTLVWTHCLAKKIRPTGCVVDACQGMPISSYL